MENLDGDARLRACALSANAYHVAASVLLKLDDHGLAWLAAERSMRAAAFSQQPLAVGSSARITTRALMADGHYWAAATTASTYAQRLAADMRSPTPESLSVYGALLLRGALAAAQAEDRDATMTLLNEAGQAGARLGSFTPTTRHAMLNATATPLPSSSVARTRRSSCGGRDAPRRHAGNTGDLDQVRR
jgi:hypothetical protein